MKITLYKSAPKVGFKIPLEIECKGDGTEENPVILESSKRIPRDFSLQGSKCHLILRDLVSRYIFLDQCQNIVIEELVLDRLRMVKCSKIVIKDLTCYRRLTLFRCEDIYIESSFIGRLRLFSPWIISLKKIILFD